MSSCGTPSRTAGSAAIPSETVGAKDSPIERVHFAAVRSFVGTDQPMLSQDGERPRRSVSQAAFWLELATVTNARFACFVTATGYVTEAERFG